MPTPPPPPPSPPTQPPLPRPDPHRSHRPHRPHYAPPTSAMPRPPTLPSYCWPALRLTDSLHCVNQSTLSFHHLVFKGLGLSTCFACLRLQILLKRPQNHMPYGVPTKEAHARALVRALQGSKVFIRAHRFRLMALLGAHGKGLLRSVRPIVRACQGYQHHKLGMF